jgi:hypothetical protein
MSTTPLSFFTPSMKLLIDKNGMRIVELKPMWFDSFYVSFLSSKYKNARSSDKLGRTNWFAASWNGFDIEPGSTI